MLCENSSSFHSVLNFSKFSCTALHQKFFWSPSIDAEATTRTVHSVRVFQYEEECNLLLLFLINGAVFLSSHFAVRWSWYLSEKKRWHQGNPLLHGDRVLMRSLALSAQCLDPDRGCLMRCGELFSRSQSVELHMSKFNIRHRTLALASLKADRVSQISVKLRHILVFWI